MVLRTKYQSKKICPGFRDEVLRRVKTADLNATEKTAGENTLRMRTSLNFTICEYRNNWSCAHSEG